MAGNSRYLSAEQACTLLGVTPATLYAYVSRGMIRSEPVEGDHRARRYLAEDVAALAQRKEQRRNPAKAAEQALNWGTPVLESALTLIEDERLYYRGYEATKLAQTQPIEAIASLMWTGRLEMPPAADSVPQPAFEELRLPPQLSIAQRLYIALAASAENDLQAYTLDAGHAASAGRTIMRLMAAVLADQPPDDNGIAALLADHWSPDKSQAQGLISAALVLCVDHELSASSFTARVVASASSNPYRVVIAGLAALEGARHGGNLSRVRTLLREIGAPENAREIIGDWLRRGEHIPGFGHYLYPHGDPRAGLLLKLLRDTYPGSPALRLTDAVSAVVEDAIGVLPSIDFALIALEDALELPRGASFGLFALGRTVGWIGHAIEQYAVQPMIRPRAKYVGPPPRE